MKFSVLLVLVLVLAGCDGFFDEPTQTPARTSPVIASATVLPVISPEASDNYIGRSDPTAAALAAEGQPSDEAPTSLPPTNASIPINVLTEDGLVLRTLYYGAPVQPAPVILLVHGEDGKTDELNLLGQALQSVGYNVMLLYLRGYLPSPGSVDWSLAVSDIKMALDTLQTLPTVPQYGVLGLGSGASAAMLACAEHAYCNIAVGVNPLPQANLPGFESGSLPILLLASEDNPTSLQTAQSIDSSAQGEHVLVVYPMLILTEESVRTQIIRWFQGQLVIEE